jgi:hypothetical protein
VDDTLKRSKTALIVHNSSAALVAGEGQRRHWGNLGRRAARLGWAAQAYDPTLQVAMHARAQRHRCPAQLTDARGCRRLPYLG